METTAYVALSRQMTLRRQMEVIANNIANMTTTGYKAEALLLEAMPVPAGEAGSLAFVRDVGLVRDLRAGPMSPTGNALDLAIHGPGYFVVETEDGERYTRSGQFRLSAEGELVTASGQAVLDDGGAPIVLPAEGGPVSVAADGTLSNAEGVLGRLQLVEFERPERLLKAGDSLYRSDEPGEPAVASTVVQGMLEGANVQGVLEITAMMEAVRAFQGAQRLIETHHEAKRRAIERMLSFNA